MTTFLHGFYISKMMLGLRSHVIRYLGLMCFSLEYMFSFSCFS